MRRRCVDVCASLSISLSLSIYLSLYLSIYLSISLSISLSLYRSTLVLSCFILSSKDLSLAVSKMSCEAGISLRPPGVCIHVHDVIKHSERTQQTTRKSDRCRMSNFYNGHSSMLLKTKEGANISNDRTNMFDTADVRYSMLVQGGVSYDKTWQRRGKARQDETKQDKTRQDKTWQDETRQGKARYGMARRDNARQRKARQD